MLRQISDTGRWQRPDQQDINASGDKTLLRKVAILQDFAQRQPSGKSRKLYIRFLVSPVELIGNAQGAVSQMRLVKNALYATESGTLRPKATDQYETVPVGLVFRSVGYRGVALPGIPFRDDWGVILNEKGRILNPDTQKPLIGLYTAGWIKRGPSGVIGTNKPDAAETVEYMLADLQHGKVLKPPHPSIEDAATMVQKHQQRFFSYEDWLRLDEIEVSRGEEAGRPRVKFTRIDDMLAALA